MSLPGREATAEDQKTGERPDERKARGQGKNARLGPVTEAKSGNEGGKEPQLPVSGIRDESAGVEESGRTP
jgi:hypothetical protein